MSQGRIGREAGTGECVTVTDRERPGTGECVTVTDSERGWDRECVTGTDRERQGQGSVSQ